MKRLAILLILAFVFVNSTWSSGQDTTEISLGKNQVLTVTESDNNTNVTIGGNRFEVSAADQSVKIRMGKRGLEILDGPGGPELDWKKYDDYYYDDDDDADERRRDRRRYTPHWAGFEMGINNFLTSDYSMSLPAELSYMDLNTGKSFNVNINFAQLGIGLSRHFGIATGLGLEFNDYKFEGNNNIAKDEDGVVDVAPAPDGIEYEKSKLSTVYLTMPVFLEAQIPVKYSRTLNIAAGAIGGVKLGSHSKVVYYDGGKQKNKENDDFSLSVLRYGPTVRLGYEQFQVYATYYMNGLFIEDKGPELYPFQVGMAFSFGD
ncbi:MAG TPA: outer membrane beta-barrel protein [Bacteroidales bacterium]|nr:outer membrane beta-barrel protein [Bacteroidales bacterium]